MTDQAQTVTHVWTHVISDLERVALCTYLDGGASVWIARGEALTTPRPTTRREAEAQGIDCPKCLAELREGTPPAPAPWWWRRAWAWVRPAPPGVF